MIIIILAMVLCVLVLSAISRQLIKPNRVGVIVLGDIGRSPRMRNHCLSLAQEGFTVQYVAVAGSTIHPMLLSNPHIHIKLITAFPNIFPALLTLLIKPMYQSMMLTLVCFVHFRRCSFVLMQNPPTIPVIGVVWLVSRLSGAKMLIDWHNYGYTILGLRFSPTSAIIKIAKAIEAWFGRRADDNFCVTSAMSKDLCDNWDIKACTLYDQPVSITKVSLSLKHDLIMKLSKDCKQLKGSHCSSTRFTHIKEGKVSLLPNRPALVVSSTSWTEDEDFSVLLASLESYDEKWSSENPDIFCIITGNGPQKEYYKAQIAQLELKHVEILTVWLEPEDYPILLGCADLGVSLHYSSSGLDLPMKVVDMFGAGVPVCARDFKCLNELVHHGRNGTVFTTSEELTKQMLSLLKKFPAGCKGLKGMRTNLKLFQSLTWHYHWQQVALPIFSPNYVLKDYGPDPELETPSVSEEEESEDEIICQPREENME